MLWSYQSLDDRIRIRNEAQQMEEWTEAGESYKVKQDTIGGYTWASLYHVYVRILC